MFPGRSVLFAVLIAAASVPVAVAQDAPPPQPSPPTAPDPRPAPEKPLARVAELVKRGQWKYARDALTKLLADYEGDDRLRVRLAEVEDHLQRCVFQTEAPKPDLLASLRRGATKFDAQKKLVTFTPADLDEEHGWSPHGRQHAVLRRPVHE